jgi:hypothetical protein
MNDCVAALSIQCMVLAQITGELQPMVNAVGCSVNLVVSPIVLVHVISKGSQSVDPDGWYCCSQSSANVRFGGPRKCLGTCPGISAVRLESLSGASLRAGADELAHLGGKASGGEFLFVEI